MRTRRGTRTLAYMRTLMWIGFAGAFLLGWTMLGATSWAQTPRPTLTPAPTSTLMPSATPLPPPTDTAEPTATSAPVVQPEAPAAYTGPLLRGRVLNLSTGEPERGLRVLFTAGGVSVEVVSDENGDYVFEHLGAANGLLNVVPTSESGLKPATGDVAVRTKLGVETVVNLGVAPKGSGAPPLIPTVQLSPDFVNAGDKMTITVAIKNTLPQAISGATITNWLPERAVPVAIRSSTGNPYFSESLAVAELGTLDAGSAAWVEIVAQTTGARTATSALQGKVSFFYRENAAAQAQTLGQASGAAPTVLPVTGVGLPLLGLGLIGVVIIVGFTRRRIARALRSR